MTLTYQEQMSRGMPRGTFDSMSDAPTAAAFGVGPAWIGGKIYWSNGSRWLDGAKSPDNANAPVLIALGDSHFSGLWRQIVPTGTITVSGGIATMTLTNAPNAPDGTRVTINRSPVAEWNSTFTIISAPTSTTVTFVAPAGATSLTVTTEYAYFESDQNFAVNCLQALNICSKYRFELYSAGVGGNTAAQALDRIDNDVLSKNPDRCLVLLGTNDWTNAASADISSFVSTMTTLYQKLLSAGIAVDACTIFPSTSPYADVANTTKNTFLLNANRWIRKYASETPGMRLHDLYLLVSDGAQTDGRAKANWMNSVDGIHLAKTGAWYVGKQMAANYADWLGAAPDILPMSQADGWTFSTTSKNRWQNHTFQGTGTATGWATTYTGTGNTKVDSVVARTAIKDGDTVGKNQKLALDSSASGSTGTSIVYQNPTARLVEGKTYIARGCATVTIGALSGFIVEINIGFINNSVQRYVKAGFDTVEDGVYTFETAPFVWPAGASGPAFYLRAVTTGSASNAVIEWGRVDLEEQD